MKKGYAFVSSMVQPGPEIGLNLKFKRYQGIVLKDIHTAPKSDISHPQGRAMPLHIKKLFWIIIVL